MKAFLLAAGYGTRLRPLTDTIPKCLVPIRGRPLLGWWFDLLRRHGVEEVLVNTHHLAPLVEDYAARYGAVHPELRIQTVFEPELLGSGGTVLANRAFVQGEARFFIGYADNLTNLNLTAMAQFHSRHDTPLVMALFHAADPSQCGIASLDRQGLVTGFVEKPSRPEGNLANAGVYLARQDVFDVFPEKRPLDLGFDVLPRLVGRMYGWPVEDFLLDIGTPEAYGRAQEEWNYDSLENPAAGQLCGGRHGPGKLLLQGPGRGGQRRHRPIYLRDGSPPL